MRNIPYAFLNEETVEQFNRANRERRENVNAFEKLAETQMSMRGLMTWPAEAGSLHKLTTVVKTIGKRLVATLEKMMEMSGPNSIANLERALQARNQTQRRGE